MKTITLTLLISATIAWCALLGYLSVCRVCDTVGEALRPAPSHEPPAILLIPGPGGELEIHPPEGEKQKFDPLSTASS